MANEDNGNDKKPPDTTIEEPVYIMAPHPEAHIVSNEQTTAPGEPEVAEETIEDLIAAQVQSQMGALHSELLTELQNELKGGELNVKG